MTARVQQSFIRPIAAAIAAGATSPPGGQPNTLAWSTTLGSFVRWTGTAWEQAAAAAAAGGGTPGAYVVAAAQSITPLAGASAANAELHYLAVNVQLTAGRTYEVHWGGAIAVTPLNSPGAARLRYAAGAGSTDLSGTLLDALYGMPTGTTVAPFRSVSAPFTAPASGAYTFKSSVQASGGATFTDRAEAGAPKYITVFDITDAGTSALVTPIPSGNYQAGPGVQVTQYGTTDQLVGGAGMDISGSTAVLATGDEVVNTVAASGTAVTVPAPAVATINVVTLTANATLTFPAAAAGRQFTLILRQDATGGRTVTWPGTVLWPGGAAPTLTVAANKYDVLTFLSPDGGNWLGFVAGKTF